MGGYYKNSKEIGHEASQGIKTNLFQNNPFIFSWILNMFWPFLLTIFRESYAAMFQIRILLLQLLCLQLLKYSWNVEVQLHTV